MKINKTVKALILSSVLVINAPMAFAADDVKDDVKTEIVESENTDENQPQENIQVIDTLSLDAAIDEAIKNSPQLKNSDFDIRLKEIELEEAKYDEKQYDRGKDNAYNFKAQMLDGTSQGFMLEANMASKSAQYALDEEKIKKDYTIEDIKYNTTNAYYGCIQAKNALDVANDNLNNTQKNRDMVQTKLDLGVASKSELLMADIALDEAKTKVESANNEYKKAMRALDMVLNYPLDTNLTLTSNFQVNEFDADVEADIQSSYEKRFDMISLNHANDLIELDFKTNAKIYPENTFMYMTKEQNLNKIRESVNDAKKSVEFDIRNKYDAIVSAQKQIEIAKANVEKAKEGVRLKELSYNSGMATSLEVKEATNTLYNANLGLSNAIANYNISILNYNKAVNIGTVR